MYIKNAFLECPRCTHSLNQTIGYRKISRDLKERALFLLDHPEICDNLCEVLGISPASLDCQILLLSAMIILIVCIYGLFLTPFEAVSAADGALGRLDVCKRVWTVGTSAIDDGSSKWLVRGALPF